jgi:hypothetical protein
LQLYEKKLQRIFYVLYDTSGNPKTGLIDTDLIFKYAKADDSAFTIKTLNIATGGNFGELGNGMYWTDLLDTEMDTLGEFAIVITDHSGITPSPGPALIDTKHLLYQIVPQPIVSSGGIPTCMVFGNIKDLGGEPMDVKMVVTAQVLKLPNIVNSNYISSRVRSVFTDEDGLFKIKLVVGSIVRLEVRDAGIRRQFQVPDLSSINIVDLPGV